MFGALALAISTTVGAGVLALPKAMSKVGFFGFLLIFFPAVGVYLLSLFILDMLRFERKPVQLPALVADFLGERWKYLTYLSLIFSMYGALTAYLIGFGDQTNVLLGVEPIAASLFLFFSGTLIIYTGTRLVEKFDMPLSILLIFFLLFMSFLNLFNFRYPLKASLPDLASASSFMAVSLFALSGVNVLPEINFLAGRKARIVVLLNTLICTFLYLFFAVTTAGTLGEKITELGTKGLALYYGGGFLTIISLFTILALFTSFIGLGLSLRHIYNFDFGFSRSLSTLLAVFPPLIIFFLSKHFHAGFLSILSLAGELTLPLFSLIVIWAYTRFVRRHGTEVPFFRFSVLFTTSFYLFLLISFLLNFV